MEQMNLRSVVMEYLQYVTTPRTPNSDPWVEVARSDTHKVLHPLLEKVFCPPATSALVERIFSHSGFLMRANRIETGLGWGTTSSSSSSFIQPDGRETK